MPMVRISLRSPTSRFMRSRISRAALLVKVTAKNAAWIDGRNPHQVGNAVSDDPGFAASGARNYQERTVGGLYGLFLRIVQSLQDVGRRKPWPDYSMATS